MSTEIVGEENDALDDFQEVTMCRAGIPLTMPQHHFSINRDGYAPDILALTEVKSLACVGDTATGKDKDGLLWLWERQRAEWKRKQRWSKLASERAVKAADILVVVQSRVL